MATSYVGQVSAHTKHRPSARSSYKDISKPSLGLDLRFEQTYLKSIAPHVRLTTPAPDENEKHGNAVDLQGQRLDIKWGRVIWITTRDQVLAPMFQGMIWSVFSSHRLSAFEVFTSLYYPQGNPQSLGAIFPP
jgi:hypothetical protein